MAGLFRSFLDSLTGKPGAPVYSTAATSGSRYASPPGAAAPLASGLVKRKVRVLRVERETADAVTLHFAPLTPEPIS